MNEMQMLTFKLAEEFVELIKKCKITVATAESCTGGLLSAYITAVSGASGVFEYGVCTYANKFKHRELHVKNKTLRKFGAVSKETASEMALGVKKHAKSFLGIGVTGIAGPTGGTPEKPVGTVFISFATDDLCEVRKLSLLEECGNDRQRIRERVVQEIFKMVLSTLKFDEQE